IHGRVPKPAEASQVVPVSKLTPNFVKAEKAPRNKTTNESEIIATTEAAKASEPYLKNPSEEGCLKPSRSFSSFSRSDTYHCLRKSGRLAKRPDGEELFPEP